MTRASPALPHLLATILEKTPRCVAWFIADKVTRTKKNANYYPRPAVLRQRRIARFG
jgi:hypothetical protein